MAKAKRASAPAKQKIKIISQRDVYKGPVFGVTTYQVQEPGGISARRDVVTHSGSVVVIALDENERRADPRVLLVRQYRHPARRFLWELPAGRKDEGETALAGAKRELIEETGVRARRWKHAFRFWASPGFLDEMMDVFLARDIEAGAAAPEDDENIEMRFFPLQRALRMVMAGEIQDAKTMTGILWLARSREGAKQK